MNNFHQDVQVKLALDDAVSKASKALQRFPKGNMGLTPDHVRKDPEWIAAKSLYDQLNNQSKAFNGPFLKKWKKEWRQYSIEKRNNQNT